MPGLSHYLLLIILLFAFATPDNIYLPPPDPEPGGSNT
jgi:hypothetical protein